VTSVSSPRSLRSIAAILRRPRFRFAAVVLIPTIIWYIVFVVLPVIQTVQISTLDYQILNPSRSRFIGLQNFERLFANPRFPVAVVNTFVWTILALVVIVPISLVLAQCLVIVRRGRNVYQAFIFLPVVVSLVAIALIFRILMDPEVGFLNKVLASIGLPQSQWLSGSESALPTLLGIAAWKAMGVYVVILTAGMLNIPTEIYDAARVDGATGWQLFRRITLPLLSGTLALVVVLLTIGSLQEYTLPAVVTEGGPGESTFLYNMLIYDEAFVNVRFGPASAAALLQFVVILVASIFWLRLLRSRWSY
jgi:ABC-type sugar transport system permease subunit